MSVDWSHFSDGELAALSIAGRQAAFSEIMRRYSATVFRLAHGSVGDPDEALDLVQETFVAAYQALGRYDTTRSMKTWLCTIAVNECRDWARKRAVRHFFSFAAPIDDHIDTLAAEQVAVEDALADREELQRVARAISTLPGRLKEVLVLRTIEGLSQSEAAVVLSISEKAVETRLYRARASLLRKLGAVEG